jgi:hypothetical protein
VADDVGIRRAQPDPAAWKCRASSRESARFAPLSDLYIIVLNINTISGSCLHPE